MQFSRREFLKGVGVTMGGAGIAATGGDRLISRLIQPQDIVPGVSTWFATSCRECPAGCGMVVRNVEQRVVKCEGNPLHPISRGSLCARGQATLQGLYDPDRLQGPKRRGDDGQMHDVSWDDALSKVGKIVGGSSRIAILSSLQTGSIAALMRRWLNELGSDRLLFYEPIDYQNVKQVYGGVIPSFNFAGADCIAAFGCDFLETWVSPIEYAHGFTRMRRISGGDRGRFIYVGPRLSMTAANADFRIIVPEGAEEEIARALRAGGSDAVARKYGLDPGVLRKASEVMRRSGALLVLPGWTQDSARAAQTAGAGTASPLVNPGRPHAVSGISSRSDVDALIGDMAGGRIDTLVVFGANPLYSLPPDSGFAEALKKTPNVISLSSYLDETTEHADWALPSDTHLESWGDYSPYPGVTNIIQPTMGQVFNTQHVGDTLIKLAGSAGINTSTVFNAYDFSGYLQQRWGSMPNAGGWEPTIQRGGVWPGSESQNAATPPTGYNTLAQFRSQTVPNVRMQEYEETQAALGSDRITRPPDAGTTVASEMGAAQLHLWAYPHIFLYDGRGANKRWLQETPESLTHAVWDTWAELHPDTARELGVKTDDVVSLTAGNQSIEVSVFVWPGVARGVVAVPMGQGHSAYGRYAKGTGRNVFPLLAARYPVVSVSPTGRSKWLTRTKGSRYEHGRNIVQTVKAGHPLKREEPITMPLPEGYTKRDFYPGRKYPKHRWAMVVDLNKCIGCGACITACYAENNLGVVGPEGIWHMREMSWVRIDRYFDWKNEAAPVLFQPMLCQQCDAAPCEPVCPVYAAAHGDEGLNMQVYNRCVGTRYCSNNCPYKVRRFNWYDYDWPEPLNWQLNPDVTVRCRGVMEKCTFCIQRIKEAEIAAARENRKLRDGDITPACVETCPAGVYTFGDLKDDNSAVSRLIKTDPRAYQVLRELNTKPAVIYLKRVVG